VNLDSAVYTVLTKRKWKDQERGSEIGPFLDVLSFVREEEEKTRKKKREKKQLKTKPVTGPVGKRGGVGQQGSTCWGKISNLNKKYKQTRKRTPIAGS